MPKLKPFNIAGLEDAENAEATFKDVPMPPKGSYKVRLKRMVHGTIKSGDNAGAARFNCLLELVGPESASKYKGYGFWYGLNLTKQGAGYCNQFLNGLAGSDEAKQRALRKAFWSADIVVDDEGHVQRIGKLKIGSPDGERELDVTTKVGKDNRDGSPRGEIASILIAQNASASDDADEDEDEDDPIPADDVVEDDDDEEVEEDEDDDDPF